jgi:hypothetical protein
MKILKLNKFGYWLVLSEIEKKHKIFCQCKCGIKRWVYKYDLIRSKSKSCGCLGAEESSKRFTKHGLYKSVKGMGSHPLGGTWRQMMCRCYNKTSINYKNYGGRGIKVCQRWHDFTNFVNDIPPKPKSKKKYTLDRINNNGNYEPNNVKWSTSREQAFNRNKCKFYLYKGKTQHLIEWSEELKINISTLFERLKRGMSFE